MEVEEERRGEERKGNQPMNEGQTRGVHHVRGMAEHGGSLC